MLDKLTSLTVQASEAVGRHDLVSDMGTDIKCQNVEKRIKGGIAVHGERVGDGAVGLGATSLGAEKEIPREVSAEAWVDEPET